MAVDTVLSHAAPGSPGLESASARLAMARRLRQSGVRDAQVIQAMSEVERHRFIEPALANRAYDEVALPIGYGQTISKPGIVARMLDIAMETIPIASRLSARALEVGTGCGYQTAVLAHLVGDVVSIERIGALHNLARELLSDAAPLPGKVRLEYADGHLGLPNSAPFHAIVVAAAFDGEIPEPLLHHLRIGARLVAPVAVDGCQQLQVVERSTQSDWHLTTLDTVRFVPMLGGTV